MRRTLLVAATILAAGGGALDAQSSREQFRYWFQWPDSTYWSRLERWVPPAGNPEAVRCVLQNQQTGVTWSGMAYLPGTAPEPPALPPLRVETITVGGVSFIVSGRDLTIDTVGLPPPDTTTPTPPDTMPVPPDTVATDTTTLPGARLELLRNIQGTRYGAEVFALDSTGAPVPGVALAFRITAGYFGPDAAHLCDAPCTFTRTTGSTGRAEIRWTVTTAGDTLEVSAPGYGSQTLVSDTLPTPIPIPPDTITPPPPPSGGPDLTPAVLKPIIGPLTARPDTTQPMSTVDARYPAAERATWEKWKANENNPSGAYLDGNHYGGLRQRLMWAIRSGEPYGGAVTDTATSGYARGVYIMRRYLRWSRDGAKYRANAHLNTGLKDVELVYRLHGDIEAYNHLHCSAVFATDNSYGYLDLTHPTVHDGRIQAVALDALNAAIRLGIPYTACVNNQLVIGGPRLTWRYGSWAAQGDSIVAWAGRAQQPSGSVSIEPWPGTQPKYFMDGMLATELFRWHELTGNTDAFDIAVRIMEFLAAEDARWQAQGYITLPYQPSSGGAAPDLAGMYVWPAMVLWQETGDARWYQFARRHLTASGSCWLGNFKQFNQCYSLTQNFPALEAGVRWR